MVNQAELKSEFLKIDDFNRQNFYPGGLPEAAKIVSGLQQLLPNKSIDLYFQLYTIIAVRVFMSGKGLYSVDKISLEDRLKINLDVNFGDLIPKKAYDVIIKFCLRIFDNYRFILALHDEKVLTDQINLKKQFSDRIKANASRINDSTTKPEYGISCENPVYADLVAGSYSYLCKLWADDETPLVWERIGPVETQSSPDYIDEYIFYTPDGSEFGTVFVNMYSDIVPTYAPVGYYSPELDTLLEPNASEEDSYFEDPAYDNLPDWRQAEVDDIANKYGATPLERAILSRAMEIMDAYHAKGNYISYRSALEMAGNEKGIVTPAATIQEQLDYLKKQASFASCDIAELIDGNKTMWMLNDDSVSFDDRPTTNQADFQNWRDRINNTSETNKDAINSVILKGAIVRDPELRYTKAGPAVVSFDIRVFDILNRPGRNDVLSCVAWQSLAERVAEEFKQDMTVIVKGYIQTRLWEDREGNRRKSVDIICDEVEHA